MSTFLPLSPYLRPQPQSPGDMQRALFQSTTFSNLQQVQPALNAINSLVQPHREAVETMTGSDGQTKRVELRYFDNLLSTDETQVRLALSELASRPRALDLLLRGDSQVAVSIGEIAKSFRVDVTQVEFQHKNWTASSVTSEPPRLSPWGWFTYWMGSLSAPKKIIPWGAGLSLAAEAAYWTVSGNVPEVAMAASAGFLTCAVYSLLHRSSASERLIQAAVAGPTTYETALQYFASFNRLIPSTRALNPVANDSDPIESIRRIASGTGRPRQSRIATARVITDFLNLGATTVQGLERELPREAYHRLAQMIGLGVLSRLGWQPFILNGHLLKKVAEYRAQGKNVIFVSNHRSHLDILLLVALLRDFGIRFVAKHSLGSVPILKDILKMADHYLVDATDEDRLEKTSQWGATMFAKGLCPLYFFESTREHTRDRREEVGMLPPAIGAAHLAARFPKNTVIVPIVSYGFGRLLPKDERQTLLEGTMLRQPTMTAILEPIDTSGFLDENPSLSKEEEVRLNSFLWARMWGALSEIQAFMNNVTLEAA